MILRAESYFEASPSGLAFFREFDMNQDIQRAIDYIVRTAQTGDLYRLYQAELSLHHLLSVAVGADMAREAYEEYNGGD